MNFRFISICFSLIIISFAAMAQADTTKAPGNIDSSEYRIFENPEIEASFPGGVQAWRRHLEGTLNAATPSDNGAPKGIYTIIVQFIVHKDGSISDLKTLTHHGYGMEGEAMKAIRKSPKWKPAIQNGQIVNAYKKQFITFIVESY